MADVCMALVHWPVYNKNRQVIASALTTVDLHDLARAAATYGAAGLWVVTPVEDQLGLARDMIDHWRVGWGARYNSNRAEAMARVHLARSLDEAREDIARRFGARPLVAGTSATDGHGRTPFESARELLEGDRPLLIVLGTAWGLTEEALNSCDLVLEAVKGPTDYNHLSVRTAAGVILDRMLGR